MICLKYLIKNFMQTLNLDLNKRYSYADYLTWFDDVRRELFDGFIKLMTPAPSITHQRLLLNILKFYINFLENKKCEVFISPFDVRFPKNGEKNDKKIYTVVQPDICVVCDANKLDEKGCIGAPDLIIEIVSEKTKNSERNSKRDVKDKFQLYEKFGVKEYWIVFPSSEIVNVFVLDNNGKYQLVQMYSEDEQIPVNIFDGELTIDLKKVFIY